MSDIRGLVISPPIELSARGKIFIKSSELDLQELRANLLFWDKLDFPEQEFVKFGLSQDSEFLLDAGVLQRTPVSVSNCGWDYAEILRSAHLEGFRSLEKNEPGVWSLAVGERSLSFSEPVLDVGRGALVSLHNAIPVPDKDVPLADLLEFRVKRRSELLALRHHLERIYQHVISAGDGALSLKTEVEALQGAISDHIKTAREAKFKLRLSDLSANINLLPVGIAAFTAYATELPMLPALTAGLVASLSIDLGAALKGRSAVSTPYRYVSSYHKELF